MKAKLKSKLITLSAGMKVRKTHITDFSQTAIGDKTIVKGKIRRSFMQSFNFIGGAKSVNNFRTLKKAYKRGGLELVAKTANHYSS